MRVARDADRGYRVEGVFELAWMNDAPSEPRDSRGGITGSGGALRNARRLPVPAFELAA